VLAVAYRPLAESGEVTPETVERDLIFVGLLAYRPAAARVIEALKVAAPA